MFIAIDIGNTRLKWGVFQGGSWCNQGAIDSQDTREFERQVSQWPVSAQIAISNVAGPAVQQKVTAILAEKRLSAVWLTPEKSACQVVNGYRSPEKLGADRWAALLGAKSLVGSGVVVVCAGTATTVDWLDETGLYCGGVILPGYGLMLSSLSAGTAQLPLAQGEYLPLPKCTEDAITSGCLLAQSGAIEMFRGQINANNRLSVPCVLTGGAAHRLLPFLQGDCQLVPHLILEGLRVFNEAHG